MKHFILIANLILYQSCGSYSQNSSTLITEVENKINKGISISEILTDKSYLSLHPENSFRNLIKDHAPTGIIAIAPKDEPGKKIKIMATVVNEKGESLPGVLVYFYQTDSKGWYSADSPGGDNARLFGYVRSDANGKIEIATIKPAGYPQSSNPAHIHVHVEDVKGYRNLITEFIFDDDERLSGSIRTSAIRNGFLNAKPEAGGDGYEQSFRYTLKLLKSN